ncbi:uncharacterized protein G2W53_023222 [Senna tora]|uniref:DUF7903 domain-containing protein n=1 Tax=Senna tora TaxID=362788 RepID=A0A834T9U6_9FABA|nr:uncharacterized protein G2W53_023222 [Senna tora]
MAYIPPHKRHSKDKDAQLPSHHLNKNPSFKSLTSKIIYAKQSVSRWFAVGLDHNGHLPPFVHLHPISLESIQRKTGGKPLVLLHTHLPPALSSCLLDMCVRSPQQIITENVLQDLLSSFQNVTNDMHLQSSEEIKPTLVARFGKVLFHGTMLRQFKRSFYTNIPTLYMEKITNEESPNIGFKFEEEKDLFHVKLSDANRPTATISCKCRVIEEQKRLQLYKIELNQVRHMVVDISCLTKNLDLRLMLCTKRILTALKDDEMQCIQDLIQSAVLDPNVKGGLRWHLGKASSGNRFSVVGVRHADRFDFRTSAGEFASEVYLKLKGIVSAVQVEKDDSSLISKMLEEKLKLIWDHFLHCEPFLG